jgi:hypothetical protein
MLKFKANIKNEWIHKFYQWSAHNICIKHCSVQLLTWLNSAFNNNGDGFHDIYVASISWQLWLHLDILDSISTWHNLYRWSLGTGLGRVFYFYNKKYWYLNIIVIFPKNRYTVWPAVHPIVLLSYYYAWIVIHIVTSWCILYSHVVIHILGHVVQLSWLIWYSVYYVVIYKRICWSERSACAARVAL